jgi:endo-1,4-beta-xylanase
MSPKISHLLGGAVVLSLLSATVPVFGQPAQAPAATAPAPAAAPSDLPPLPPAANIPKPGTVVNGVYAPQPILPGGVVVPLFPPDSPYLKKDKLAEIETYNMDNVRPGRIASIVNIHNPSVEFHPATRNLNTGMAIILVAGGGHRTLNVGGESGDFVHFFANFGINTVILRNRMRVDGYDAQTDSVYDAQQAIKVVRAYAARWQIDPKKIGIMGFSAGAELAAPAALKYEEFDQKNDVPGNPFGKISSRPDFTGIIYPGPTPFTIGRGGRGAAPDAPPPQPPAVPRDAPPSFIMCAGWGDRGHAIWADDWFRALLNAGTPNVEMHIYAKGRHPGDQPYPGDPAAFSVSGLADRGGIAMGTWQLRFLDWARDLGFTGKPGEETIAAKDIVANMNRPPPGRGGGRGRGGAGGGSRGGAPGAPGAAPQGAAPAPAAPGGTAK